MDAHEFKTYRNEMEKTQKQMSHLLGVSLKAVQGYEQGWRQIPPAIERQIYFLVYQLRAPDTGRSPCWIEHNCPLHKKENCPAWEFKLGHLCWFINGTHCDGVPQSSWQKKITRCRNCPMFESLL